MNVTYVSALYNIYETTAYSEVLLKNVQSLLTLNIRLFLYVDQFFYDALQTLQKSERVTIILKPLSEITTYTKIVSNKYRLVLPYYRSKEKDTCEYMALMNSKPELMKITSSVTNDPYIIWIDAGIFKIFKDVDACKYKLEHLYVDKVNVLIPGCYHGMFTFEMLTSTIVWMFCGGFIVCNRDKINTFYDTQVICVDQFLLLNVIAWEVNVWVFMYYTNPGLITWYQGTHDDTILCV